MESDKAKIMIDPLLEYKTYWHILYVVQNTQKGKPNWRDRLRDFIYIGWLGIDNCNLIELELFDSVLN